MLQQVPLPTSSYPRVVVIGGGFAGLTIARKLRNKLFQVVIIDRNNFHTFQPLLYQVAMGGLEPDSIAYPLRKIFKGFKNVTFRLAEVESVDADTKVVHTSIGQVKYDYLVIATGSTSNFFGMKDLEENAMPLKSLTEALDLRSLMLQNIELAITEVEKRAQYLNFIIVGGGPTGVELAGALGELRRHVLPGDYPELADSDIHIYLVENDAKVLGGMSAQSSAKAEKFLDKLGIHLLLSTKLVSYDGHTATLGNGDKIEAQTLIWSAGVKGQVIAGIPAGMIERGNRFRVNRMNEIEGLKDVFAIGDVAVMTEEKYPKGHPMVAQVAIQQAARLAKNLLLKGSGKSMLPFHYKDRGSMATVGRNKAVVDLPFIHFQGALAWFAWMAVHLMTLVGFRNRLVVFINWVWSYFSYDRAIRLIVRPFKGKKDES